METEGRVLIPLRIYFKEALVKVEIALATGKKTYDKREDLRKKTALREVDRALLPPPGEAEGLKSGAVLNSSYPKKKVEDLIARRVQDMFKLIEAHLKKIGKDELLPAGIILTGGGSAIHTVADLAKAVLRLPSRTASLAEGAAAKMQLRDSSWAVAYGLTVWGFSEGGELEVRETSTFIEMLRSAWKWFKKFLP